MCCDLDMEAPLDLRTGQASFNMLSKQLLIRCT